MNRHPNRARGYIEDLLEGCTRISQFTAGKTRESFLADRMLQDATIRNLEILGEASRQLRDSLPDAYDRFPQIPFRKMYALRNNLAHGYLTVNLDAVWDVVEKELPSLLPILKSTLANWPSDLT